MSDAEKVLRDKIIRRWQERHDVFRHRWDTGYKSDTARVTYYDGDYDRWCYTTGRMFDGKFWSFRYRWVRSTGQWKLVRSSLRRHAKRKDAKARAYYAGEPPVRPPVV